MFDRIISEAMRDAGIADAAFEAAIKKAGFKSRWDWFLKDAPGSLIEAYNAKVEADRRMHEAFVSNRSKNDDGTKEDQERGRTTRSRYTESRRTA